MYFAAAGIECSPLLPLTAAFAISLFTSGAGISGAFLLLPFQIGVLGYTAPSVSATNQFFNILACPAGVWRFWREGRLLWPLAAWLSLGTLPGVFLGALARGTIFRQTDRFLIFVALVLLYVGQRLIRNRARQNKPHGVCKVQECSLAGFVYEFGGETYSVRSLAILFLGMLVGLVGGIYGVGGGALISPFLVAFLGLPIHTVAGACLFTTFLTSILGVLSYWLLGQSLGAAYLTPDWLLGLLLGLGGAVGMYIGAATQKYLSPAFLRKFLGWLQVLVALIFLCQVFFSN